MVPVELLQRTDLAPGLSEAQLATLASLGTSRTFQPGETILELEDSDYRLHVLLEGEVNVLGVMGDVVGAVRPGNLLGEISFIDGKARSAKVVAAGEVHLAEFPSTLLDTLVTQDPHLEALLLQNLARVLCRKLRTATREIDASLV
jgi:CRP-like cAMP-binding protein